MLFKPYNYKPVDLSDLQSRVRSIFKMDATINRAIVKVQEGSDLKFNHQNTEGGPDFKMSYTVQNAPYDSLEVKGSSLGDCTITVYLDGKFYASKIFEVGSGVSFFSDVKDFLLGSKNEV